MNDFDFQAMTPSWLTKMADPLSWQGSWQDWMKQSQMPGMPPGAVGELGKLIDPGVAAGLQAEYLQEMGALCQELLAGKTPEIADRRFGDPAWRANPWYAFQAASYLLHA